MDEGRSESRGEFGADFTFLTMPRQILSASTQRDCFEAALASLDLTSRTVLPERAEISSPMQWIETKAAWPGTGGLAGSAQSEGHTCQKDEDRVCDMYVYI